MSYLHQEIEDTQRQNDGHKYRGTERDDYQGPNHHKQAVHKHKECVGQFPINSADVIGESVDNAADRSCVKEGHGGPYNAVQHFLVEDS